MQRFEHDMVSISQVAHGAWLIDMPPRMVSLQLTPAVQRDCNHPTVAICFRVRAPSEPQGYHFLHLSSTPCQTRDYR